MAIVGATWRIKYDRFRKPPSRATGAYRQRNTDLPGLGYSSYYEYLKSPEWAELRRWVLQRFPNCCVCDSPAHQVHHWDYHEMVLLGLNNQLLLPICERCHKEAEFDGSRKRSLKAVQKFLHPNLLPLFKGRIRNGMAIRRKTLEATIPTPTPKKNRRTKTAGRKQHQGTTPPQKTQHRQDPARMIVRDALKSNRHQLPPAPKDRAVTTTTDGKPPFRVCNNSGHPLCPCCGSNARKKHELRCKGCQRKNRPVQWDRLSPELAYSLEVHFGIKRESEPPHQPTT